MPKNVNYCSLGGDHKAKIGKYYRNGKYWCSKGCYKKGSRDKVQNDL